MKRFGIIAALLLVGFSGGVLRPAAAAQWGKDYLPNVPVLDQNGRELRFYDDVVKDKIVIISFIYTSCRDICPVVTARMAQVQDKLGEAIGREIFFVSLSVDPANDTPEKLKAYAEAFGADPSWLFLTGKMEDINLLRYKLGERSRKLSEHGNTIMMFNAATSEWSRDSAFSDLSVLTANIRTMSSKLKQETQTAHDHSNEPTTVVTDKDDLPGQSLFIKTCAACHTVGKGAKVGPDLSGVTTRRSREWIVDYLVDPVKMRAKGDPTALQLAKEFPTVRMPSLSLSTDDAADLIGYVEALTRATTAYGANTGAAAHEPGTPEPPGQTNAAHHH